jgi:hypothetical protein
VIAVATSHRTVLGTLGGANLPPRLTGTFTDRSGFEISANTSADWRGVRLLAGNPVTADPAIRAALNRAVDRQAIVDHVLAATGVPRRRRCPRCTARPTSRPPRSSSIRRPPSSSSRRRLAPIRLALHRYT